MYRVCLANFINSVGCRETGTTGNLFPNFLLFLHFFSGGGGGGMVEKKMYFFRLSHDNDDDVAIRLYPNGRNASVPNLLHLFFLKICQFFFLFFMNLEK